MLLMCNLALYLNIIEKNCINKDYVTTTTTTKKNKVRLIYYYPRNLRKDQTRINSILHCI